MAAMSPMSESKRDFRDEAVTASEASLAQCGWHRQAPAEGDLVESGLSYCVKAEGDGQGALRRLRRRMLVAFLLGFVLLGMAIVAIGVNSRAEKTGAPHSEAVMLVLAGSGVVGFLTLLFYAVTAHRRVARRLVLNRILVERGGASEPVFVCIEDGQTFQKPKLLPEDIGAVILHPASRCVQIEGVTHRYMIYAEDVLKMDCVKAPAYQALTIEYTIDPTNLQIALFDARFTSEVKRQTIGSRNKFFHEIQAILASGPNEPGHADA